VQARPGQSTDVLVQGRPNKLQIAGKAGGVKLLETRRLAAKGHRITIIGEKQFWTLVEGARRSVRQVRSGRRTPSRGSR
jgi:hypothetical protein